MSAKFAYAQWPWGTQSREEFIQSCKDMSEVGFEYFESVKAFIDTFKDSPEDFKSICDEYSIHPISFYFHLTGKHDDDIAELKDKIGFVRDCGIKTITVQGVWSPIPATHDDLIYASKTIIDYGSMLFPGGDQRLQGIPDVESGAERPHVGRPQKRRKLRRAARSRHSLAPGPGLYRPVQGASRGMERRVSEQYPRFLPPHSAGRGAVLRHAGGRRAHRPADGMLRRQQPKPRVGSRRRIKGAFFQWHSFALR